MNVLLMMVLTCLGQVGGGGQDEMEALVERIRENLTRVDDMLLQSAEADDVATGIGQVVDTHVQVIRDLEELIKQMKYTPSSSSSSSSSGESPESPSSQPPPRENDGSQSPQDGEGQQPQSPQEQENQEQQDGSQGGEEQQEQQESQSEPQGGMADNSAPRSEEGGPPPPDTIGDFTREHSDQRWGLLPPKLQERLLNLHVDDVPEQYRVWLEAYIRRMHTLESGSGR